MANKKGAFKDLLLAALLAAFLLAFNERFFRLSAGIWRVGGFCLVPHFQHHRTLLHPQQRGEAKEFIFLNGWILGDRWSCMSSMMLRTLLHTFEGCFWIAFYDIREFGVKMYVFYKHQQENGNVHVLYTITRAL